MLECVILTLKMHQSTFLSRLCLDPLGQLTALPGLRWIYRVRWKWKSEGKGRNGRTCEERGRKWKWNEEIVLLLSQGFLTRGKFFLVGILWLLGEIETTEC